jgi:hypothetical protein
MICSTNGEQLDIPTNSGIALAFYYSLITNLIIYAEACPNNYGQIVIQISKLAMMILTMIIMTIRILMTLIQVLIPNVLVRFLLHQWLF